MSRRVYIWSLLFAAALSFGCVVGCNGKPGDKVAQGGKLSKIKLQTADGKAVDLSRLGAPAVLIFYGPNHKASAAALGQIQNLVKDKRFKNVKILAITRGKDKSEKQTAEKEFKSKKWPFTLVFDPALDAAKAFNVTKPLPVVYLLDKKGSLASQPIRQFTGRIRTLSFADMLARVADGKSVPHVDFIPYTESDAAKIKMIGKPAPKFSFTDLKGRPWSQNKLKGKGNLLVVFWSPGCPHCRVELPRIRKFSTQFAEKFNLEILTITRGSGNEDKQTVQKTLNEIVVDFPAAMIADDSIYKNYNIEGVPTAFIINKNGVVCEFLSGETQDTSAVLKSIFEDPVRMNMK